MEVRNQKTELWRYRLERPVGGSGVGHVDIVVVELEDAQGRTGWGFSYVLAASGVGAARAAQRFLEDLVVGVKLTHPEVLHRRATASMNRTGKGLLQIGLAAVDVALWDLYAKILDLPLGTAMGGTPRRVPVYGSGGLRAGQDPGEAAEACRKYVDHGIKLVKPRVSGVPSDKLLLAAVREAVGDLVYVAADANEKCTAANADWLMRVARDYELLFVEEPLPAHDLAGHRALSRSGGPALATGEHLQGLQQALPYMVDGICGIMQPDLAMMGGLTACLNVARFAEALGIEIAPHFLPNLFVHLAAVSPAVTWLEDFPVLEPLFGSPPTFNSSGYLDLPLVPGHGLELAEGARRAFLIKQI
jgi:L-alanine-DL-glutamate epimerase-like enolase superfamily enzyme